MLSSEITDVSSLSGEDVFPASRRDNCVSETRGSECAVEYLCNALRIASGVSWAEVGLRLVRDAGMPTTVTSEEPLFSCEKSEAALGQSGS